MTSPSFPDSARPVIIGGGVDRCSVAYHLTKLGWRDVVLLEQGRLTCSTTWHAAGLVGQLRAHQNMTRLVQYSAQLYQQLEVETGQATGRKGWTAARCTLNITSIVIQRRYTRGNVQETLDENGSRDPV